MESEAGDGAIAAGCWGWTARQVILMRSSSLVAGERRHTR